MLPSPIPDRGFDGRNYADDSSSRVALPTSSSERDGAKFIRLVHPISRVTTAALEPLHERALCYLLALQTRQPSSVSRRVRNAHGPQQTLPSSLALNVLSYATSAQQEGSNDEEFHGVQHQHRRTESASSSGSAATHIYPFSALSSPTPSNLSLNTSRQSSELGGSETSGGGGRDPLTNNTNNSEMESSQTHISVSRGHSRASSTNSVGSSASAIIGSELVTPIAGGGHPLMTSRGGGPFGALGSSGPIRLSPSGGRNHHFPVDNTARIHQWSLLEEAVSARDMPAVKNLLFLHAAQDATTSASISRLSLAMRREFKHWARSVALKPPQRNTGTSSAHHPGGRLRAGTSHRHPVIRRGTSDNNLLFQNQHQQPHTSAVDIPVNLPANTTLFAIMARSFDAAEVVKLVAQRLAMPCVCACTCTTTRLARHVPARTSPTGSHHEDRNGGGRPATPGAASASGSATGSVSDFMDLHSSMLSGRVFCLKTMYGPCDFSPTAVHRALLAGHDAMAAELLQQLWRAHDRCSLSNFLVALITEEVDDRGRNLFHFAALVGGVKVLSAIYRIVSSTVWTHALCTTNPIPTAKDKGFNYCPAPQLFFSSTESAGAAAKAENIGLGGSTENPALGAESLQRMLLDGATAFQVALKFHKALLKADATGSTPIHCAITAKTAQGQPERTCDVIRLFSVLSMQIAVLSGGASPLTASTEVHQLTHPVQKDQLDVLVVSSPSASGSARTSAQRLSGVDAVRETKQAELGQQRATMVDVCARAFCSLLLARGPQQATPLHEAVRRSLLPGEPDKSASAIRPHDSEASVLVNHQSSSMTAVVDLLLNPREGMESALLKEQPGHLALGPDVVTPWWSWSENWDRILTTVSRTIQMELVDSKDSEGQTPLSVACTRGNELVLRHLLAAGALPNEQKELTPVTGRGSARTGASSNHHAPLHIAVRKGYVNCAAALLEHGAKVDLSVLELASLKRNSMPLGGRKNPRRGPSPPPRSSAPTAGGGGATVPPLADTLHHTEATMQDLLERHCFLAESGWGTTSLTSLNEGPRGEKQQPTTGSPSPSVGAGGRRSNVGRRQEQQPEIRLRGNRHEGLVLRAPQRRTLAQQREGRISRKITLATFIFFCCFTYLSVFGFWTARSRWGTQATQF